MQKEDKLLFLNMLRGFSCLVIVFFHLFFSFFGQTDLSALWPFFPKFVVEDSRLIQPSLSEFFNSFHLTLDGYGVAIFFLITGFTTSLSIKKNDGKHYMLKRVFRIYPTYIAGFSITILSIYIFSKLIGNDYPYTLREYLCHISLFRNWLWSPYIDNGVWTLEMNMDFYILVFAIILLFKKHCLDQKLINVCGIGILICEIIVYSIATNYLSVGSWWWCRANVFTTLCPYLIFQFIGSCAYNHYSKRISRKDFCKSLMYLCAIFIISSRYSQSQTMNIPSYFYGLFTFLLFYVIRDDIRECKFISFISEISYPLYVVHALIGYMLLTVLYHKLGLNPYVALLIVFAIVIAIAFLLHITIEKWSEIICKKISTMEWKVKND